ncbi:unnamed protein product [Prunus armeniaca]
MVYFGVRIKYQDGEASREVGLDNVYNSARVIHSTNASIPKIKVTNLTEGLMVQQNTYLSDFCN